MNPNDRWIAKNFGRLVDLYGGRCVAVSGGRVVAVGARWEVTERRAQAAGKGKASVVRVPAAEQIEQEFDPIRLFRFS